MVCKYRISIGLVRDLFQLNLHKTAVLFAFVLSALISLPAASKQNNISDVVTIQRTTETERITNIDRIVAIDWTHVETLLALGVIPVGVAQKQDYATWVAQPRIPSITQDLGLRTQPNLEAIKELSPTRIYLSPMFSALAPQLERIADVKTIGLYSNGHVDWQAIENMTRAFAMDLDIKESGESLIHQTREKISTLKAKVPVQYPPVTVVQFMDANHLRVFGQNSLYKASINALGIESEWQGDTNKWGFALASVDQLLGLKGQIIIVEPLPIGTEKALANNQLWQYIKQHSIKQPITVPAVWSFGGLPSLLRFSDVVAHAIEQQSQYAVGEK